MYIIYIVCPFRRLIGASAVELIKIVKAHAQMIFAHLMIAIEIAIQTLLAFAIAGCFSSNLRLYALIMYIQMYTCGEIYIKIHIYL